MIDECIERYGTRLYGLCRYLCANPSDADDLYQDTWLRVLKYISRYDPSRAFEPWLTGICVNTYRSALRRAARHPLLSFSADGIAAPEPEKEDYSPLHAAIDRLPKKLRLTVILYYFEDMDIAAAADALSVPPGTVKSRLSRARRLLKEALIHDADLSF